MKNWKWIKGYEGLYKITTDGLVYEVKSKRFISLDSLIKSGNNTVTLYKDGKHRAFTIHKLTADHFILNPEKQKM